MSKTIYEEALQELSDATTDLKDLEIIHSYDVSKIEKALKQAQKQEKLLNKIKEIIDRQEDSYISSMLEESRSYYEIKKLMIKELEKEGERK